VKTNHDDVVNKKTTALNCTVLVIAQRDSPDTPDGALCSAEAHQGDVKAQLCIAMSPLFDLSIQ
jgi:hypothetical protein